jgi:hypothetical protein
LVERQHSREQLMFLQVLFELHSWDLPALACWIYINIKNILFEPSRDEFTVRVVEKAEEVKGLLEVGFEYICQKDNLIFLRKRK